MNNKIKIFLILIIIAGLFLSAASVYAGNAKDNFKESLAKTAEKSGYTNKLSGEQGILSFITVAVGAYGILFVGLLFLMLLIWAGYLWMTAKGNEQQIEKARTIISASIIGMIIILGAYALTYSIGKYLVKPAIYDSSQSTDPLDDPYNVGGYVE